MKLTILSVALAVSALSSAQTLQFTMVSKNQSISTGNMNGYLSGASAYGFATVNPTYNPTSPYSFSLQPLSSYSQLVVTSQASGSLTQAGNDENFDLGTWESVWGHGKASGSAKYKVVLTPPAILPAVDWLVVYIDVKSSFSASAHGLIEGSWPGNIYTAATGNHPYKTARVDLPPPDSKEDGTGDVAEYSVKRVPVIFRRQYSGSDSGKWIAFTSFQAKGVFGMARSKMDLGTWHSYARSGGSAVDWVTVHNPSWSSTNGAVTLDTSAPGVFEHADLRSYDVQVLQNSSGAILKTFLDVNSTDGQLVLDPASLADGTYKLRVKAAGALSVLVSNVTVQSGYISNAQASLMYGDVDGDNDIDVSDLNLVQANLGQSPSSEKWLINELGGIPSSLADVNRDGVVDSQDLNLVSTRQGLIGQ